MQPTKFSQVEVIGIVIRWGDTVHARHDRTWTREDAPRDARRGGSHAPLSGLRALDVVGRQLGRKLRNRKAAQLRAAVQKPKLPALRQHVRAAV